MLIPVASYPKSGNTWLRLLLLAYEQGEAFDMNARPAHYVHDAARWAWEQVAPCPVEALNEAEVAALRPAVLVAIARSVPGSVVLKTHAARVSVGGVPAIAPEMVERALVVVRDPRDVAPSFADHLGVSIDEAIDIMGDDRRYITKRDVVTFTSSWSVHVSSWLAAPFPTFTLRYEDMLADTVGVLRRVAAFLGWPADEARLRSAVDACAFDALRAAEDRSGYDARSEHQARFFRQGQAGAWRSTLTTAQAARIEHDHGEAMASLSYEVP